MTGKVIPLADHRYAASVPVVPSTAAAPDGRLLDRLHRPLRDLRISVTDRCNFRCSYCMPKDVFGKDYAFLPQSSLLTFEELTRVARIFVAHGVRKIRLTGGEPLLRRHLERLIEMLGGRPDVVLSDMAAPTTGHRRTDHLRTMHLVEAAGDFAIAVLKPGGHFLAKAFQGGAENELLARLKRNFRSVHHVKPPASRAESVELYLLAKGFRGGEEEHTGSTHAQEAGEPER